MRIPRKNYFIAAVLGCEYVRLRFNLIVSMDWYFSNILILWMYNTVYFPVMDYWSKKLYEKMEVKSKEKLMIQGAWEERWKKTYS